MDYSEAQQTRLFDRSSYLPRTISVYQIVGAYLVDIYYNHLFAEAHKFRGKGDVPTVTEGYRHATFAFLSGLDHNAKATYKAQHYKQLLIGINEYFKTWTSFNTLTVSDCVDKIVREFIPDDYFKQLDKEQKGSILRMVLTNTLREFTKIVIGEFLAAIVDNHEEPANVEALKDRIIDLMISEREKMFHKFLASHFPASGETVDKKFAERMRDEITKLQAERDTLKTFAIKQQEEIELRKDQLAKVVAKFRKMESAYRRIVDEYKVSKESIAELESQVHEYERNKTRFDAEDSEFMSSEPAPSVMDSFIGQHVVKNNAVQSASGLTHPQSATPAQPNKVEVKTSIGTLAPSLPSQQATAQQSTVQPKPPAKPAPKVTKPPAKPVVKTGGKPPAKSAIKSVETKPAESEEEESESEEEEQLEVKPEPKVVLPNIKAPAPAATMASLVEPPKSPKATLGTASNLDDAY